MGSIYNVNLLHVSNFQVFSKEQKEILSLEQVPLKNNTRMRANLLQMPLETVLERITWLLWTPPFRGCCTSTYNQQQEQDIMGNK